MLYVAIVRPAHVCPTNLRLPPPEAAEIAAGYCTIPAESPLIMAHVNAAAVPPQQLLEGAQHPDRVLGQDLMLHPAYWGVSQCLYTGRWVVIVMLQGSWRHIWNYATAELAAEAYDVVALALHAERALTNLPLIRYSALLPHVGYIDVIELHAALRRNQEALLLRLAAGHAALPDGHPSTMAVALATSWSTVWRRRHVAEAADEGQVAADEAMALHRVEVAAAAAIEAAVRHHVSAATEVEAAAVQERVEALVQAIAAEVMVQRREDVAVAVDVIAPRRVEAAVEALTAAVIAQGQVPAFAAALAAVQRHVEAVAVAVVTEAMATRRVEAAVAAVAAEAAEVIAQHRGQVDVMAEAAVHHRIEAAVAAFGAELRAPRRLEAAVASAVEEMAAQRRRPGVTEAIASVQLHREAAVAAMVESALQCRIQAVVAAEAARVMAPRDVEAAVVDVAASVMAQHRVPAVAALVATVQRHVEAAAEAAAAAAVQRRVHTTVAVKCVEMIAAAVQRRVEAELLRPATPDRTQERWSDGA
ncbi:hypothetical protein PLESTF_001380500 [Pleodorina starrii]|nr:hypothetical protein PLESTM_000329600 [Pleodorina starrii]GLC73461.1 hypothetical protein PLESTF_001380500 [Pleodorina starrii]